MRSMKEGDIVLTPLPQADGKIKLRPALLLRQLPPHNDFLVCGISSQARHEVKNFDEMIKSGDDDYKQSGLLHSSLIRLGFLAVIPVKDIVGSIGSISSKRHRQLLSNLTSHLLKE